MTNPSVGQWTFFDTEVTDAAGRISYRIPDSKRLSDGMYPVKMVVRWDLCCGWITASAHRPEYFVMAYPSCNIIDHIDKLLDIELG